MLEMNGSSDEDSEGSGNEMNALDRMDSLEAQEEMRIKIEKRADLLAETL